MRFFLIGVIDRNGFYEWLPCVIGLLGTDRNLKYFLSPYLILEWFKVSTLHGDKGILRFDHQPFSGKACRTHIAVPETMRPVSLKPESNCWRIDFMYLWLARRRGYFPRKSVVHRTDNFTGGVSHAIAPDQSAAWCDPAMCR